MKKIWVTIYIYAYIKDFIIYVVFYVSLPQFTLFFLSLHFLAHKGSAYLLVTATDSGNPPKTATVPITIHFPDSNIGMSAARGNDSTPLLLAGLGAVLLVLTFVVGLLIAYICKV